MFSFPTFFLIYRSFLCSLFFFFFFNDTATTEIYTLSLHDALPIYASGCCNGSTCGPSGSSRRRRSEEHTSELQSQFHIVCRLLLEKKKQHTKSLSHYIKKKNTKNKR